MTRHYAIAYSDKTGNGYSQTEPWLLDDFDNVEECSAKCAEMIIEGYRNVTIFEFDAESEEAVSWKYVRQRMVSR